MVFFSFLKGPGKGRKANYALDKLQFCSFHTADRPAFLLTF